MDREVPTIHELVLCKWAEEWVGRSGWGPELVSSGGPLGAVGVAL